VAAFFTKHRPLAAVGGAFPNGRPQSSLEREQLRVTFPVNKKHCIRAEQSFESGLPPTRPRALDLPWESAR